MCVTSHSMAIGKKHSITPSAGSSFVCGRLLNDGGILIQKGLSLISKFLQRWCTWSLYFGNSQHRQNQGKIIPKSLKEKTHPFSSKKPKATQVFLGKPYCKEFWVFLLCLLYIEVCRWLVHWTPLQHLTLAVKSEISSRGNGCLGEQCTCHLLKPKATLEAITERAEGS